MLAATQIFQSGATPALLPETNTVCAIADLLSSYFRIPSENHSQASKEKLYSRIELFVERNDPIEFILPSFPYKSPNSRRVLGALPDRAEELTLCYLSTLTSAIEDIYRPGVRFIIASDGRVYSKLQQEWWPEFSDATVTRYRDKLIELVSAIPGGSSFHIFSLETFGIRDSNDATEYLKYFSPSIEEVRLRIRNESEYQRGFVGLKLFRTNELSDSPLVSGLSLNAIKRAATDFTVAQLRAGAGWSNILKSTFPEAIRLSVHNHLNEEKLGIRLFETSFVTPWHSVALYSRSQNNYSFCRYDQALAQGARIVYVNGQASYLETD